MLMSSIVWSYSKDLLHHAAIKIHLVVGKFQGKKKSVYHTFSKKKKKFVSSILCITINRVYACIAIVCDSSKHDNRLSFSITFMNNNPHIAK